MPSFLLQFSTPHTNQTNSTHPPSLSLFSHSLSRFGQKSFGLLFLTVFFISYNILVESMFTFWFWRTHLHLLFNVFYDTPESEKIRLLMIVSGYYDRQKNFKVWMISCFIISWKCYYLFILISIHNSVIGLGDLFSPAAELG